MSVDPLREEELESQWEAAPAVALVIGLQLTLALVSHAQDWKVWVFSWWVWLIPVGAEAALLIPLAWHRPRRRLEQLGLRRTAVLTLLALVSLANSLLLFAVIASLVRGQERSGAQLLLKAITVWGTNVTTFGLWFWVVDRGGPVRRRRPDPPPPDFLFPQLDNPRLAGSPWEPQLLDYVYVAFTNAIAFSPTDVLPLTRRAKLLMLFESALSALTILLVAARAVNIFRA
jgi:hypothetical protein